MFLIQQFIYFLIQNEYQEVECAMNAIMRKFVRHKEEEIDKGNKGNR